MDSAGSTHSNGTTPPRMHQPPIGVVSLTRAFYEWHRNTSINTHMERSTAILTTHLNECLHRVLLTTVIVVVGLRCRYRCRYCSLSLFFSLIQLRVR